MKIQRGVLMRSPNNQLGIGKVIEASQEEAKIEYFCSIGQRISRILPLSSLKRVKLQPQTRCYLWSRTQERWLIGRIAAWDDEQSKYQIRLPDGRIALAGEAALYVRCNRPIDDPIDTLAMKAQETPYFHDRRLPFVQSLIQQRAISRGMTGLISANIELYPHQVEVVRRVLEDPIQRYLLADEVGLGKTIEAGTILRQYLLDEPNGRGIVLVPQYLLQQWRQELEEKFYLSYFGDRVQVLAVENWRQLSPHTDLDILILDEAHHIAAMATATDPTQKQCFETCKHLAHRAKRLLLLSATPVLNHEQNFLAMLHLLDPATYHLEDLEGFRERVQKRQEIGRILLSFQEGSQPLVLKTNLTQLQTLFTGDNYLLGLADKLQSCLSATETNTAERDRMVRAIRTHISDTYRLHRRMLRNRRESVEDVIFERQATPTAEYDLDERSPRIHELLEEWRIAASKEEYSRIFLLLFRASSTWLGMLKQVITARLKGGSHPALIREFGAEDVRLLLETPKFAGEVEILQSLLKLLEEPSADGDRIELLKLVLLNHLCFLLKLPASYRHPQELAEKVKQRIRWPLPGDCLPKILVFTSFLQSGQEILRALSELFGKEAVASHLLGALPEQAEADIQRFKKDQKCFILVCDRSGEEGRNFQLGDWVIHFDLPWSPNQLEQRIGRVDRIGSKMGVKFSVLAGPDLEDSPQSAWYQLLKDGFCIFTRSIASLQFYVDEQLPVLETVLFQSGAKGLLEMQDSLQKGIENEQVKISEQNALDEIDALDESATQYFQALEDYDARHQEIQRVSEDWICQVLQFKRGYTQEQAKVLRYHRASDTLIPADHLATIFHPALNQLGTYNRRTANQQSGINLYRIGEGLIEALSTYIHWDDRGQAFAMWRCEEKWNPAAGSEWLGFRFNYVVEADLQAAKKALNQQEKQEQTNYKALKRRVDALYPPLLETIFLEAGSEPMTLVEDAAILEVLQRPYKGKGIHQFRDYNLAKNRLPILDSFVAANEWPDFCKRARHLSETLLRSRPAFAERCDRLATSAEQKLTSRIEQLRLRFNRLYEAERFLDSALQRELNLESALSEAILNGIRHPRIRLDSVGFIVISGRPPSVELLEETES